MVVDKSKKYMKLEKKKRRKKERTKRKRKRRKRKRKRERKIKRKRKRKRKRKKKKKKKKKKKRKRKRKRKKKKKRKETKLFYPQNRCFNEQNQKSWRKRGTTVTGEGGMKLKETIERENSCRRGENRCKSPHTEYHRVNTNKIGVSMNKIEKVGENKEQ